MVGLCGIPLFLEGTVKFLGIFVVSVHGNDLCGDMFGFFFLLKFFSYMGLALLVCF